MKFTDATFLILAAMSFAVTVPTVQAAGPVVAGAPAASQETRFLGGKKSKTTKKKYTGKKTSKTTKTKKATKATKATTSTRTGKADNEHAKAGKVVICHGTSSLTNPYVMIDISKNAEDTHMGSKHNKGKFHDKYPGDTVTIDNKKYTLAKDCSLPGYTPKTATSTRKAGGKKIKATNAKTAGKASKRTHKASKRTHKAQKWAGRKEAREARKKLRNTGKKSVKKKERKTPKFRVAPESKEATKIEGGQCVADHVCATIRGDPHLTTFDGLKYDCQGHGEFVLARSMKTPFEVQGRFVSAGINRSGKSVSITKAVSIDTGVKGAPQFDVFTRDTASGCAIDYYVNGALAEFGDDGKAIPGIEFIGDYDIDGKEIVDYVYFTDSGVMYTVLVKDGSFGCVLNSKLCLPPKMVAEDDIIGLLGSPNGDQSDDWMKTTGENKNHGGDVHWEKAYDYCSEEWCVHKEEDSIFGYVGESKWADFYGCAESYNPAAQDLVENPSVECEACCSALTDKDANDACLLECMEGGTGDCETEKINDEVLADVEKKCPDTDDPNRSGSECLPTLDFEVTGKGDATSAGDLAADLWKSIGITISTLDDKKPAMLFDTANPTGGDTDLASDEHGMVLIISEDGKSDNPDDNAGEGTIILEFDDPVYFDSVGMFDIEEEGTIAVYDPSGTLIAEDDLPTMKDGEHKRFYMKTANVGRIEFNFGGSGAITDFTFCADDTEEPENPDPRQPGSCSVEGFKGQCKTTGGCKELYAFPLIASDCRNNEGGICYCESKEGKEVPCGCEAEPAEEEEEEEEEQCPDEMPEIGSPCGFKDTCPYGTSTCCDGTVHASFKAVCMDGTVQGYYTDACMAIRCEATCSKELRLCEDGSSVGRSGPDCEFAECPPGVKEEEPESCGVAGPGVEPELITANGNPRCSDMGYQFGWKMDNGCSNRDGAFTFDGGLVYEGPKGGVSACGGDTEPRGKYSVTCGKTGFATIETEGPVGIFMKSGNGGSNLYRLEGGGVFENLQTNNGNDGNKPCGPQAISHITFCFNCPDQVPEPLPEPKEQPEPQPLPEEPEEEPEVEPEEPEVEPEEPEVEPEPECIDNSQCPQLRCTPGFACPTFECVDGTCIQEEPEDPCNPDVLTCKDGSVVSRSGPNCEFAKCPTPEDPENPDPRKGSGSGDPHFKTWTGDKYDYHGECDLVLVDSPGFNNGQGLRVHIRTTRVKYFSYIEKVAVQIGDEVLEFDNDVENFFINGEKVGANQKHHKTLLGGFVVRRDPKALSIRLHDEGRKDHHVHVAKIDLHTRKNGFPAVIVDGGHTDIFNGSLGLLGDWSTGKKLARDGETEIEIVGKDGTAFALEWQVRDTEPMLFKDSRFPQFPTTCTPPNRMTKGRLGSEIAKKEAEEACAHWEEDQEDCIFDVIATRDILTAAEGHIVHVE